MKMDKTIENLTSMCSEFKKNYGKNLALTILLLFSVLGALISPGTLNAQASDDINFEHISIEHGLSQGTVSCIIQDNRGFMWFGTENGLNRYDGHEFRPYTYDSNNPNTLSHNLVISIFKEQSGTLWIGTQGGGLNKFDPKTEKFTSHRNNQNFEPFEDMNIRAIHEDGKGILWIGTDKGLYNSDQGKNEFQLCRDFKNKDEEFIKKIKTIYEGKEEEIWIGADDGLVEYKSNSGKEYFEHYPIETGYDFNIEVDAICEDQPGELWIGTIIGLYKFDRKTGKFTPFKDEDLKNEQISVIFKDKKNTTWIGTAGDGLYQLDPEEKRISNYRNIPNDFTSLSNNYVLDIYQNKLGLIWIGTFGGGINKLDPVGKKFALYKNSPGDPDSLSNNEVRGICQDTKGGIWVSTRGGGLSKFDLENKKFKRYLIGEDISRDPRRNEVNIIQADHFGNIWVGTFQSGLYKFILDNGTFHPYESNSIKRSDHMLSINEDKQGYIWIGIEDKGMIELDKNKERKELKYYKNIPGELSNNNVYVIFEDHSGTLWIGTGGGGLNKFDKGKEQFTHYIPQQDNPNSLSHNFISAIYEDQKHNLWIGTGGGGLNKLVDREKEIFKVYTTKHGLPNNVIYDILEDKTGNLWITTNRGVSKFNPGTGKFINFTTKDGLQGWEFNQGAACYSKETGMMFLGGFNGLNVFEPGKISDIWSPPDIVITSFKKLSENVLLNNCILEGKELKLSYKENVISIGFAALNFSDPENNQYAYKMEPNNKDWIPLGNKHNVDFTGLRPDKYTFHVKGADSHGVWSEKEASIKIRINPPFWKTWWFYTLIISALVIGVFTVIKMRTRRIENQKRILQEIVDERTDEINRKKEELEEANVHLKQEIEVRHQAEASLKESEERYRQLVETSPDAIIFSDAKDGGIILANPQCLLLSGYSNVEEMRKHVINIFNLIDEKDRVRALENAEEIKKGGLIKNNEYMVNSKYGISIAVEIRTALIKDTEGKPKYFLSVIRDIQERKEAEKQEKIQREKLIQADKMISLGTLVSGIAHEINTPLASIKMNSEIFDRVWHEIVPVLDKHYVKDKDFSMSGIPYEDAKTRLEDLMTGLKESSQRIEKIINDLRDYSRPSDTLPLETIDINKVIESSANLTHNMLKKSTKNFSIKLTEHSPLIRGNFRKLEQVFINLIRNACQSLVDISKKIEISTTYEKEKKQIVIKVMDEGIGIKEEHKKYIFNPFFTTRRDQGGTGLGLYISMQIVKEHKGRIEFHSQEGKGTTVTVTLPIIDSKTS
jgi:PAS domain S-box-containing protein